MVFSILFTTFLLILCNFVNDCFDFNAYCNSARFMTNSTFKPIFADDAFVKVCMYAQQESIRLITAFATPEMCTAKSIFVSV
jgi:hypothetical protein